MKIIIFTRSANHPRFAETLRKFGKNIKDAEVELFDGASYKACDVAVFFGSWKNRNVAHHNIKREIVAKAPNYIMLETPLLGRKKVTDFMEDTWYRIGLNGFLNDTGSFNNKNMSADRWNKIKKELNIDFSGFRTTNNKGPVTIALQLPGDASLRGADISAWAYETACTVRENTNRLIIIRYPQLQRQFDPRYIARLHEISNLKFQQGTKDNLRDTLAASWCTITYSSGLGVDSIMEGTPTIACDPGNFAYPISSHKAEEVNNPERQSVYQWLYDLSYCQWNVDEIEQGLPWNHLKEGISERTTSSAV
jgi:hypothetical protein